LIFYQTVVFFVYMKQIILLLCASLSTAFAIDKDPKMPQVKLELSEHSLTTDFGVLLPSEIIKLQPDSEVKIKLPDGTTFRGTVTKSAFKEKYLFECLGEVNNFTNTGFGFVVTNDGIFGAIVMRDTDTIFHVKFSEEANGFVLLKRITPVIRL
jgi:hypothetical protein